MAMLLQPDGTETEVRPASGGQFTLPELQGYVCGYIEMVQLHAEGGGWLVVDEEGSFKDLPLNLKATKVFHDEMHLRGFEEDESKGQLFDVLTGPALVCSDLEIGE